MASVENGGLGEVVAVQFPTWVEPANILIDSILKNRPPQTLPGVHFSIQRRSVEGTLTKKVSLPIPTPRNTSRVWICRRSV